MSDDATTPTSNEAPLDWSRFDAMTEEERRAGALSDPDAQSLSEEDVVVLPRVPQARVIRRASGLPQRGSRDASGYRLTRCATRRDRVLPRGGRGGPGAAGRLSVQSSLPYLPPFQTSIS